MQLPNHLRPAQAGNPTPEQFPGNADTALQDNEELYRRAVELSRQIPWITDQHGQVLYLGSGWTDLTGMSIEDGLGDGWLKAVHPEDLPHRAQARSHSLSAGEPYECEYRVRLTDGSYRWFRTRAGAQRNEAGEIVRWYGAIEDIHGRKQAEQAHKGHARVLEMVASGYPLGEILDALCRRAEEQIAGARCSVLLLDPELRTLHHGAAPNLPAAYSAAIDGLIIGPGVGSCGGGRLRTPQRDRD